MRIILILLLTLVFAINSHADEVNDNPQTLNDELNTASGDFQTAAMQPVSYHYSQQAAACRNSESQTRANGSNAADASVAYYHCLQQLVSQ